MKKVPYGFLILGAVLPLLVMGASAASISDLTYAVDGGEVTITGCKADASGALEIPASIQGYPVTKIGEEAFQNCEKLTSVIIPNGVVSIGDSAFYDCYELTTVSLPDSVTSIGQFAFSNCRKLTQATVPAGVTELEMQVFAECDNLTAVELPAGLKRIGDGAFFGCNSLSGITIPDGVTEIGAYAFDLCTSLTSIVIPSGVTEIGAGTFDWCYSLTSALLPEGITSIGDDAFYNCSSLVDCDIPSTVTEIGENAFAMCGIKRVVISAGVTEIKNGTFDNCKLEELVLPEGLLSIGDCAFRWCPYLEEVTLPDSLTSIGREAFRDCSSLTSFEIPANCTSLGAYFLNQCDSLTALTVDSRNPAYMASDNMLLTKDGKTLLYVTPAERESCQIPVGVTTVAAYAFESCKIGTLSIPASVTEICQYAFDNSSIGGFEVAAGSPSYSSVDGVIYNKDQTELLFYATGRSGSFTVPSGVTRIGDCAFVDCFRLEKVSIPQGVTELGVSAFEGCTYLETVTLPETLKKLGDYAFYNCKALSGCVLPDSLESIGDYAFLNCTDFTPASIPESVTYIGVNAFLSTEGYNDFQDNETGLCWVVSGWLLATREGLGGSENWVIPDSVKKLAAGSCSTADSVVTVTIPASVELICDNPFIYSFSRADGLTNLGRIDVDPNNQHYTSIDGVLYTKDGKTLVAMPSRYLLDVASDRVAESYTVPEGVTTIGRQALAETRLSSLQLPSTLTTIQREAMINNWNLRKLTIPSSVTFIGENAFYQANPGTEYVYDPELDMMVPSGQGKTTEITAEKGSYALEYAKENGLPYVEYTEAATKKVEEIFTDVKAGAWYVPYVQQAYDLGLMTGDSATTFGPNGVSTRASFVQSLYAMAGKPPVSIENPFADVKAGAWYEQAVLWAYANQVTGGTGANTFSPNLNVTREQIAVFLYAYAGRPAVTGDLSKFADAGSVSSWARTAVIWATQNGIISGSADGNTLKLKPQNNATRAETATMMVGFYKLMNQA